jgi:hypothetical protein
LILLVNFKSLQGYDCHLLIEDLCKQEDDLSAVTLIPKSMEKYTAVITPKFKFIDSFSHMTASLDQLTNNLTSAGTESLEIIDEYVNRVWGGDPKKKELLLRKGVYPYSYMDSWDKFEEGLPPIEAFYNDLKDEPCTEEDYAHVQNVWNEFNLKNLGELCDLYVTSDVKLLTAVMNQYRLECYENFKLDPLHYYTAPGTIQLNLSYY